jgi:hypothetical protein
MLRIGPITLCALKNEVGDEESLRAYKDFIFLSRFNNFPVMVACYYVKGKFQTSLIWDS